MVLEKQQLEKQLEETRTMCRKLELHAATLEEASVLSELTRIQKIQIDGLKAEVQTKSGIIDAREQRLAALEYDLSCLRSSVDVQRQYEGSVKGGVQTGREMMRTLYCDLSKKQTDLQKTTLALAECRDELKGATQAVAKLSDCRAGLEETIATLNRENEAVIEENSALKDVISKNSAQIGSLKDAMSNFQGQVEDLSRRLSESRFEREKLEEEAEGVKAQLESENRKLVQDNTTLAASVEHLEGLLAQKDTLHMVTEKKLQSEWKKLNEQKLLYAETLEKNEILESQLALFRSTYTETVNTKEESVRQLEKQLAASKAKELDMNVRYTELRGASEKSEQMIANVEHQLSTMILQRDEAVEALQQCMLQFKTVNRQYLNERSIRGNAEEKCRAFEKELADLKASKEYALNAVLDALQQEKDRASRLERLLGDSSTASYYYEKSGVSNSHSQLPARGKADSVGSGVTGGLSSNRGSPLEVSQSYSQSPPQRQSPTQSEHTPEMYSSSGGSATASASARAARYLSAPSEKSTPAIGSMSPSPVRREPSNTTVAEASELLSSTHASPRPDPESSESELERSHLTHPDSMRRVSDNIARLKQQFDAIVTADSAGTEAQLPAGHAASSADTTVLQDRDTNRSGSHSHQSSQRVDDFF